MIAIYLLSCRMCVLYLMAHIIAILKVHLASNNKVTCKWAFLVQNTGFYILFCIGYLLLISDSEFIYYMCTDTPICACPMDLNTMQTVHRQCTGLQPHTLGLVHRQAAYCLTFLHMVGLIGHVCRSTPIWVKGHTNSNSDGNGWSILYCMGISKHL